MNPAVVLAYLILDGRLYSHRVASTKNVGEWGMSLRVYC